MKSIFFPSLVLFLTAFSPFKSCSQDPQLKDYYSDNSALDTQVEEVLNGLSQNQKIAQLLMPAMGRLGEPEDSIRAYVKDGLIGGILMLNGTKAQFTGWVQEFNELNKQNNFLPFLYSADAEPSLVNSKIKNSTAVPRAIDIQTTEEARKVAEIIATDLNDIGINYNFAPVVDMSSNKTVGYRGFGAKSENIVPFSTAFIAATQDKNILATAKHFPGHGLISGDTHASLQVINGEMKEVGTYIPLIKNGVLSIMIAHIAVQNNPHFDTKGLPATCSEVIVTKLLRDSLGFNGLVVTDAMNMGGVSKISDANVRCITAGCDILLMPLRVRKAHAQLSKLYTDDVLFRAKVDAALRRIIRAKICLGLLNEN